MGCFIFYVERKDAEGWETVQRGRPVRSRSTALATKTPIAAEPLKSKGDSDKETVISPPSGSKRESSLTDNNASKSTDLVLKDPLHHSEGPLTEKTQVSTVLTLFLTFNSYNFFFRAFSEGGVV